MAITTTREQRRRENHERALAAYMEHHAAAMALISRIQTAIENHDLAPDSETITWGTVGSMEKTRHDLQALSDWLFNEGRVRGRTALRVGLDRRSLHVPAPPRRPSQQRVGDQP